MTTAKEVTQLTAAAADLFKGGDSRYTLDAVARKLRHVLETIESEAVKATAEEVKDLEKEFGPKSKRNKI